MDFLAKLFVTALAVIISTYLLSGVHIDGFFTAIIVAAVLSFLNAIVKPMLVLLTIPITFFTLGLFLLVINALIILITDQLVSGFKVDSFFWALGFSLILSLVNAILNKLSSDNKQRQ